MDENRVVAAFAERQLSEVRRICLMSSPSIELLDHAAKVVDLVHNIPMWLAGVGLNGDSPFDLLERYAKLTGCEELVAQEFDSAAAARSVVDGQRCCRPGLPPGAGAAGRTIARVNASPPPNSPLPIYTTQFAEPGIEQVDPSYSTVQQAVLPVVGFANGWLEPFATAFCISTRLSLALTAWHNIEKYVRTNGSALVQGTCQLAVMLETDQQLPDGRCLGGPVPVYRVTRVPDTDLALLQLYEVDSPGVTFTPMSLAISFQQPVVSEWCYGFGYPAPHLAGGNVQLGAAGLTAGFSRSLHATAGNVLEVLPGGHGRRGHPLDPTAPMFDCDAPGPHGVSGGPFRTDSAGLCGLLSSALDPSRPGERWLTYVSLFTPLLGCPIQYHDGPSNLVDTTIRELAADGLLNVEGDLPQAPLALDVEPLTLPPPSSWA